MPFSLLELTTFIKYFSGNTDAYGIHKYSDQKENNKQIGENYTKKEPLTDDLYKQHLNGKQGLGVVPIRVDNTCSFCVIDVDVYTDDTKAILNNVYKGDFPLVPFRSKSGGLHLYLFFNRPVKAETAKAYLKSFILLLGLNKNTEIFPKQDALTKGQTGNWINLPYYNAIQKTNQYLIKEDSSSASIGEALQIIESKQQDKETLSNFFDNLPLMDAPPCLQAIYLIGDTDYRNEYLFSLARYFKTKYGDDFEFKLVEANNLLHRPISIDELNKTIIAAHKKKDYTYKCKQEPIVSICNKEECKRRKYGIGGIEVSDLSYEDFIQYDTDPPYYEWVVNNKSLKFYSEQDIINQVKFRELCFRELHILPAKLKDLNWTAIINNALGNIIVKDVSEEDDISPGAMFKEYLKEFLEDRAQALTRAQILFDRVYKDDSISSYVFKAKNLVVFLIHQKQFRFFGQTEIQDRLRALGGFPTKYYIDGDTGSVRVWILPYDALFKFIEEEPSIEDYEVDFSEDYPKEAF